MDNFLAQTESFSGLQGVLLNIAIALMLLVGGWWLAKRLSKLSRSLLNHAGLDSTISGFLGNAAYLVILVITLVAALATLGVPTASFLTVLGAAGLAIGLALQGSLSNIAAGFLLIMFRPCKAGDYIEANGVSGTVTDISLFSTTLRTPDQRTVIVPNSGVIGGPITNYSTSPIRRLDMVYSVAHDSDLPMTLKLLREIVSADERVLADKELLIGVLNVGPAAIDIAVRPWVNSGDYWPLHFDLHEKVKIALDQAGVTMLVPPVLATQPA